MLVNDFLTANTEKRISRYLQKIITMHIHYEKLKSKKLAQALLAFLICYSTLANSQSNTFWPPALGVQNSPANNNQVTTSILGGQGENVFIGHETALNNTAGSNTHVGYRAGHSSMTFNNTLIGSRSGWNITNGGNNTFVGTWSGYSMIGGFNNTFMGFQCGFMNTNGTGNVFLGKLAGYANLGSYNIAIGWHTGYGDNATGTENIFIGKNTGRFFTTGFSNVAMGTYSAHLLSSGTNNTFIGGRSGYAVTTGGYNSFFGYNSGDSVTTGSDNTFMGDSAGFGVYTGSGNTFVGKLTKSNSPGSFDCTLLGKDASIAGSNHNNATALGAGATANCNNCMVLGNGSAAQDYSVTMGTTHGTLANLHVGDYTTAPNDHSTRVKFEDLQVLPATRTIVSDDAGNITYLNGLPQNLGLTATCTTPNFIPFWTNDNKLGCSIIQQSTNLANCSSGKHSGVGIAGPPLAISSNGCNCYRLALTVYGSGLASGGIFIASDKKFKKNIEPLKGSLEHVLKLNGLQYEYNTEAYPEMQFPDAKSYGFIAQDIQKYFPELVIKTDNDFLAVNYEGLVPVLVEAMKEQQKQIEEKSSEVSALKSELAELSRKQSEFEQALSQCCSSFESKSSTNTTGSNSAEIATLQQNVPNPFTEKSTISFYIPKTASRAAIKIYMLDGTAVKSIDILTRGMGQVEIAANSLTSGTYVYHLLIDGKQIDSKLMTLTK